jgi:uncharacterized membrane protein
LYYWARWRFILISEERERRKKNEVQRAKMYPAYRLLFSLVVSMGSTSFVRAIIDEKSGAAVLACFFFFYGCNSIFVHFTLQLLVIHASFLASVELFSGSN